jgi:hypothetical protein
VDCILFYFQISYQRQKNSRQKFPLDGAFPKSSQKIQKNPLKKLQKARFKKQSFEKLIIDQKHAKISTKNSHYFNTKDKDNKFN